MDDKTIRRSQEEGRPLGEVTRQWTAKFHADCRALNCLPPHIEPAATGHIREQTDMIEVLMKKGNAYRAPDGSVYFKVSLLPGLWRAFPPLGTANCSPGRPSRLRMRTKKRTLEAISPSGKPGNPTTTSP